MDQHKKTQNSQLIKNYLDAFSSGEPAQVAAHVTEGFINQHFGLLGGGCETKAAYEKRLVGFLAGFNNLRYDVEAVCTEENEGTARYKMHFEQEGTAFEVPGMMWFEIEGGKIAKRIDCWDGLTYLKQAKADAAGIAAML
jgi:ketosteroid isomerase-like protein